MKIFVGIVAHCYSILTLVFLSILIVAPLEFPAETTWDEKVVVNGFCLIAFIGACCNVYVVYTSDMDDTEEEN